MDYVEIYEQRIRSLCKQRGISINKLADMSNVRQSSIDNIVNGRTRNPGVVNLHKIAITFNMTLAEFLDFDELNNFSFDDNEEEEN
jgi:transcriptional regulator with XRE-family HTH domain